MVACRPHPLVLAEFLIEVLLFLPHHLRLRAEPVPASPLLPPKGPYCCYEDECFVRRGSIRDGGELLKCTGGTNCRMRGGVHHFHWCCATKLGFEVQGKTAPPKPPSKPVCMHP